MKPEYEAALAAVRGVVDHPFISSLSRLKETLPVVASVVERAEQAETQLAHLGAQIAGKEAALAKISSQVAEAEQDAKARLATIKTNVDTASREGGEAVKRAKADADRQVGDHQKRAETARKQFESAMASFDKALNEAVTKRDAILKEIESLKARLG